MTRLASEQILDLQQPLTWCDRAIEVVLAAMLLFTPAAIGTTEPWSQQIWFLAVGVMAVLMTVNLLTNRQSQLVWTWAYVPIVAYLLLVTLSLIPLPAGVLNVISPGTIREKAALLSDLPNVAELTATSTISFEVWSTERGLRIVAALSVIFVVAVNTFRTPQQIKRLLIMIVGAGAAVTLLTLAQDFTAEPGTIYWVLKWDVQSPHPRSGPFFGHAQLGQYMNLTIGATLALTLVLVGEAFAGGDWSLEEFRERLSEPGLKIAGALVVLMGLMAIASALAASRGALIGMMAGAVVAVALLLIRHGKLAGTALKAAAAVFLVAVVIGGTAWIYYLPKLFNDTAYSIEGSFNARKAIREKVPHMIARWPVMGTGLESFEWVYPWFQDNDPGRYISDHAENDYLQTLTDTGIVGGVITAAFLAIIGWNWLRAFRGQLSVHLASIGIAFALVAVMVHSLADFAQRTPAIGMLSSLLCAMVISLSRIQARPVPAEASPQFGYSPVPRLLTGAVMVAVMAWAVWSIQNVRMGDAHYWISDPNYTGDLDPRDPEYDQKLVAFFDERIDGCQTALSYDPKVVKYIHFLNDFRWRKLSRQRDPETHQIIFPSDVKEQAQAIVNELAEARALCPTFGPLYVLQGKVLWETGLDREEGRKLLRRGYDLLPINPETHFYLAELAAAEGNWEEAINWARQCYAKDSWYEQRILDLFLKQYNRPEELFEVMKGSGHGLYVLSISIPKENVELHQKISDEGIAAQMRHLEKKPDDAAAMVRLAQQLDRAGRKAEAADYVAKALRLEYDRTDWRLYRARLLRDLGRDEEAIDEAQKVLRTKAHSNEAKSLLDALQDPKRKRDR